MSDEATAAGEPGAPLAGEDSCASADSTASDEGAQKLARRKLLKAAAYGVPMVLGTLLTRRAAAATCAPPQGCNPIPCGPPGCLPMQ